MLRRLLMWITVLFALAPSGWAKENNPNVELEFVPQQSVDAARFVLRRELYDRPFQLQVTDQRRLDDKAGPRTRPRSSSPPS